LLLLEDMDHQMVELVVEIYYMQEELAVVAIILVVVLVLVETEVVLMVE
jgi:hypothetical protein